MDRAQIAAADQALLSPTGGGLSRRRFIGCCSSLMGCGMSLTMSQPLEANDRDDFLAHQARRRQELWCLLGDLPQPRSPQAKLLNTTQHEGYTLEHLELDLNGIEPVPAYLLLPDKRAAKAPGLLYIHAHGGTYDMGKEELIQGRKQLQA